MKLGLRTLPQVRGGIVELMFDKAILRAIQDVQTAPDIADARTVELTAKLKPVLDQGELVDVDVEFAVNGKVPRRSTSTRMAVRHDMAHPTGPTQLFFNVDSPGDPDQSTLFEEQESG